MPWVLGIAVAVAALLVCYRRARRAAGLRFMKEVADAGLSEYHLDLMANTPREEFLRRYMIFVAMLGVQRRLAQDGRPTVTPGDDPVEEAACRELVRLDLLERDPAGSGYRKPGA
jgi:hypothetical protein